VEQVLKRLVAHVTPSSKGRVPART
jgi:hypothetical protein